MNALYELLERRRHFIRRHLYSKEPAVIGANNPAEITQWKLAIGKQLFLEIRRFRWTFLAAPGEPGSHSPRELLTKVIRSVQEKFPDLDGNLNSRLEAVLCQIEAQDGCLEWRRLADAVLLLGEDYPGAKEAIQDLYLFCLQCWQSALKLATPTGASTSVLLPPNLIFLTREGLIRFADARQPVAQPVYNAKPTSSISRIGPFVGMHRMPPGPSGASHSLDFSVLIRATGVELQSRCGCEAEWTQSSGCFQHFPI